MATLLKDPDNFKCDWCGNSVLTMTWDEILSMMATYRELEGRHATQEMADVFGGVHAHIYMMQRGQVPSYDRGRAIALFLKQRFREMERDKIHTFHELYPHLIQTH